VGVTGAFLVQLFVKGTVLQGPLACMGQFVWTLQPFIHLFFCCALGWYLTGMKVNKVCSSFSK